MYETKVIKINELSDPDDGRGRRYEVFFNNTAPVIVRPDFGKIEDTIKHHLMMAQANRAVKLFINK